MMPSESPESSSPISEKMEEEKSEIKFDKSSLITEGNAEGTVKDSAVAESSAGAFSWYSSWGTSLLQSAKEKTISTYELVKKDLGEFKDAVAEEAKGVASSASTVIYEQASNIGNLVQDPVAETAAPEKQKSSSETADSPEEEKAENEGGVSFLSSWVNPGTAATAGKWVQSVASSVTKVLVIDNAAEDEEKFEIPITSDSISVSATRLNVIQSDPRTYSEEPEGAHELFDDWLESFDLQTKDDQISELLGKNAQIRTIYAQLVPSKVSNTIFWERYFYRIHQFELDEARRASLIKRSSKSEIENAKEKLEQKTSWEDSDEEDTEAINKLLEEEFGEKKQRESKTEPVTLQPTLQSQEPMAEIEKPEEKVSGKKKNKGKGKKSKGTTSQKPSHKNLDSSTSQKEATEAVHECKQEPEVTATPSVGVEAGDTVRLEGSDAIVLDSKQEDEQEKISQERLDGGDNNASRLSANGNASGATSDHDSWSVCSGKEIIEEIPSPDLGSTVSVERISIDEEEEEMKETTPEPSSTDLKNQEKKSLSEPKDKDSKNNDGEPDGDWIEWDD